MSIVTNPDPIIARISAALRALDGTKPVIGLGGAHAKGQADEHSDIDFYVFASGLPAAQRLSEDLASRLPEAAAFKTWSGAFEAGVDFDFAGQVVEVWFRDTGQVRAAVDRALSGSIEREDRVWTPNGFYSSTVLSDLRSMRVLYCEDSAFAALLETIRHYPEAMRRTAFDAGLAPLRFWRGNMHLATAIARVDSYYLESICHQVRNGLIQSAFAVNRTYFGGDKKMRLSLQKLAALPERFTETVLDAEEPTTSAQWHDRFESLFAAGDQLAALMADGSQNARAAE